MSKFDEPEPGAVSGAVAEPHQMSEVWNSVKQLAAILGLFAATFFLLDTTASLACLIAATALPVAFGGLALHGPCPVGFSGSCFQYVPMGAAMLPAAMRLCSCTRGFVQRPLAWRKIWRVQSLLPSMRLLRLLRPYLWFFDNAATAGPAALVPWFFAIAFAAL